MEIFVIVFIGLILLAIFVTYKEMKTFDRTPITPPDREWLKTESPIQRRVLAALRNAGHSPRTEVPVGRYRIDIAFPVHKLAIETDGKANHTAPKDKARDRRKDAYLRRQGWKVLRFTGSRINRDINGVVRRIDLELQKRQI